MHELSLVTGIVGILEESAARHGVRRITMVRLRVGELTAALPDQLRFCFQVVSDRPLLVGARLEIEQVPAMARCRRCEYEFPIGQGSLTCPTCGTPGARFVTGTELVVDSYEGE